jgi:hypothetical protein
MTMVIDDDDNSKPLSEYLLWKLGGFRFSRFTEHDHSQEQGLDLTDTGTDLTSPAGHRRVDGDVDHTDNDDDATTGRVLSNGADTLMDPSMPNSSDL